MHQRRAVVLIGLAALGTASRSFAQGEAPSLPPAGEAPPKPAAEPEPSPGGQPAAPPPSEAAPPPVPRVTLGPKVVKVRHITLKECLELAERNYPKVREAAAQLERMNAQLWEARTTPFSHFTAAAGLVLAPTVEGTSLYSPNSDAAITSSMALAWRVGIEGAIPLWTFGKITSAIDAAEAQIEGGKHAVKKAKNEVALSVRRAYYGVQLARDAGALLDEAIARVDKYLPQAEEKVRNGEGDDIALLKLKMQRAELVARRSDARKEERVALAGLRFLTGGGPEIDVPDVPLKLVSHTLGPLARYLSAARLFRPEVNMAHAGVRARDALRELERARFFPDIGVGIAASRSYAPEITDQTNPFVRDDANYTRFGAGLVLKWDLDFLPRAAKLAQAQAQLEEIRATERYALGGIGVEVETAFVEADEGKKRLDSYAEATRYAKQWLVKVQQGIDVGTFEENDIVDPAKEYALKRFAQMSAVLDYNVAIAKLALATGWDVVSVSE